MYRPNKVVELAPKSGELGKAFLRFEKDRRVHKVSYKTLQLYENAWKFFGPKLQTWGEMTGTDSDFEKPATRKLAEKQIPALVMDAIEERQAGPDPLKAASLNMYIVVANTFLKWLKNVDELLQFDHKIEAVEDEKGNRRKIFSDADVAKLMRYKPGSFSQKRAWTIAMLMLDCGCRIEEALTLTKEDIDLDNDLVTLIGKGNKLRRVPITQVGVHLSRWINKQMPSTAKYIFGTATGTMLTQENASRDVRVVQRKAGMAPLSWHSYRHTFATIYLRNGKIDKLQRILGHSDLRTTAVYLHMDDSYVTDDHENVSPLSVVRV
jgi:integrase/recombinase XerD